ncbi:hypothetical protein D3C72_1635780 [compost metagenome]
MSGCSLDASIASLDEIISVFNESEKSTMAVAPSQQADAKDEFNQYRVQSTVGEVTTGESTVVRGTKTYRTEISITYQKM